MSYSVLQLELLCSYCTFFPRRKAAAALDHYRYVCEMDNVSVFFFHYNCTEFVQLFCFPTNFHVLLLLLLIINSSAESALTEFEEVGKIEII